MTIGRFGIAFLAVACAPLFPGSAAAQQPRGAKRLPSEVAARLPSEVAAGAAVRGNGRHANVRESILVVAPHPDDETLGCGGVIQQSLKRGGRVTIVIMTFGEHYEAAAAILSSTTRSKLTPAAYVHLAFHRQVESLEAMRKLGLKDEDVLFLGYPNEYLDTLFHSPTPDQLILTSHTESNHAIDAAFDEYHLTVHGVSAPYNRASILSDLEEIIRKAAPSVVYVTDSADKHPDHRATFQFVREALKDVGSRAAIYTYVIHAGYYEQWPGKVDSLHRDPFIQRMDKGKSFPMDMRWPPPIRIPLTRTETQKKLEAIRCYDSENFNNDEADYLESFARGEEVFWLPK